MHSLGFKSHTTLVARFVLLLAVALGLSLASCNTNSGHDHDHDHDGHTHSHAPAKPDPSADADEKLCPVSGEIIEKAYVVEHEGQKIELCCKSCAKDFLANPTAYLGGGES